MKAYRFFLFAILVLLIGWSLKAVLFKKGDTTQVSERQMSDSITERVRSFSLHGFSESGEKTWKIEGKSADIFSDVINLTDINANSYDNGKKMCNNLKGGFSIFQSKEVFSLNSF